jgi:hypothetical protein
MKNLIKRIIKEGILSKQRGIVPDMAGKIGPLKKKTNYTQSGKFNVRTELMKLVIQFIRYNYPNDLERYKGKFMYKLNKSMYYLSDDDAINYDSIFLKAVNSKDEKSIELANKFLSDIETDNIRKSRVFKGGKKIPINNQIKEQYKELKEKINLCNFILDNELKFKKWDKTKYGYNMLSYKHIDDASKVLDNAHMKEITHLNYNVAGDKAGVFLKKSVNIKLIQLENEMEMMINKYGEENLI